MNADMIAKLKSLAERRTWSDRDDDECIVDFSGDNVDDAFDGGRRAGETELARELLDTLGIEYEVDA